MFDLLQRLLVERGMAPHGYCLLWEPTLIWTHVLSDVLIGLSYFSIPVVIATFLTRRRDVQFSWVVWMFAVFIMACGATHFMSILTLWVPAYGVEALVKLVTAGASVTTAVALWPLLPRAIAVPSPAQLQRANDELSAIVIERDHALAALEREAAERARAEDLLRQAQKLEAVGQLTSGIAHDFNNLLTIVLASLDRAGRLAGDNAALRRCLANATDGAERAAKVTDQLLSFSRRQPVLARALDLNALVEDMRSLLEGTLGARTALAFDLAPDLPPVTVDETQAQNAILNLAINARDAMPAGGVVTVSTRREVEGDVGSEAVVVAVADTGVGMDEAVRERVFEPFYTTKPVGQGTGLGLSQVYGFAKQAGGDVALETAPGRGTTVAVRLPITKGGGMTPATAARPRVLIVEDEALVRSIAADEFVDAGFEVRTAADGVQALDAIGDARFDLLFTDIRMPGGIDGWSVAEAARAADPTIAVIYVTGFAEGQGKIVDGGVFLRKPYRFGMVLDAVRRLRVPLN